MQTKTERKTGVRGFAEKADRVRRYLATHPGAGSHGIASGAGLRTPGPMGDDGRSDALAVCAVLEGLGEVVRKTDGSNYSFYLVGDECRFPLNPEHDPEASGEARFAVRRNRRRREYAQEGRPASLFAAMAAAVQADADFDRALGEGRR